MRMARGTLESLLIIHKPKLLLPRGELHCVVSHNLNFVNQKIRQLELENFAQGKVFLFVPGKIFFEKNGLEA